MASESDCRAVDSDECEVVMNNFIIEQRCHGFAYYLLDGRSGTSFDSDNMIDFPATGSVPGKQQCKPVKKIPQGLRPVDGAKSESPASLSGELLVGL